jgi:hypothetical protein
MSKRRGTQHRKAKREKAPSPRHRFGRDDQVRVVAWICNDPNCPDGHR